MPHHTQRDDTATPATRSYQLGIKTIDLRLGADGLWTVHRYIWPTSILAGGEPTFPSEAEAIAGVERASGRSLRAVGAPVPPAPAPPRAPVRLDRPARAPAYPFASTERDVEPRLPRLAPRRPEERPLEPVRRVAPVSTPIAAPEPEVLGTRRQRVDGYRHLFGTASDAYIANRAKVTENFVREYRLSMSKPTITKPAKATKAPPSATDSQSPSPARSTPEAAPRTSKLDDFRDVLGTVSDREVARLAGVNRTTVVLYRQAHDIPACPRTKPAPAATVRLEAPVPEPPAAAPATRTSKLDHHRDLLGQVSDEEVAAVAGVSRKTVLLYRKEHNIPAMPRGHVRPAIPVRQADVTPAQPAPPARDTPRTDARGRASRLDAYRDILGVERDSVVASRAGVSDEAVRQYRLRNRINATWVKHTRSAQVPLPIEGAEASARALTPLAQAGPPVVSIPEPPVADNQDAAVPLPADAPEVPAEPVKRRASRLDAFLPIIGVLSDAQVAEKAGYTPNGVAKYRVARGIQAASVRGGRRAKDPVATQAVAVHVTAGSESLVAEKAVQPSVGLAGVVEPAGVASSVVVAAEVEPAAVAVDGVRAAEGEPSRMPDGAPVSGAVQPSEAGVMAAPLKPEDRTELRGYYLTAAKGKEEKRWLIVGAGITDAMVRATRALEPGWRIVSAREIPVSVLT